MWLSWQMPRLIVEFFRRHHWSSFKNPYSFRADFWEGDATKHFSVKRREVIQWMRGLVGISTGKAIQWRGSGHSLNRRTRKTEKLLSSCLPKNQLLLLKPRIWEKMIVLVKCKHGFSKCSSPYSLSVFCPGDGFRKTPGRAEGIFCFEGNTSRIEWK